MIEVKDIPTMSPPLATEYIRNYTHIKIASLTQNFIYGKKLLPLLHQKAYKEEYTQIDSIVYKK